MFLEQQILILEWFLKERVTLKTENSALITGINYILLYKKICFKYLFLYCILDQINATLIGEHKRLLSKLI